MVDVSYQRRMAAEILKCGVNRVWIDPDQVDEVAEAVTRGDVRRLICYRVIQKRQIRGVSQARTRRMMAQKAKGRRKGPGSRRGGKFARGPRKRNWIRLIRPLRDELKTLRGDGKLDATTYRVYYRKARGNMFKSRSHMLTQMELAGVITEGDIKEKETAKERARREREERRAKAQAARARVRAKAAEARAKREAEEAKNAEEAKKTAEAAASEERPGPTEEDAPEEDAPEEEAPEEDAPAKEVPEEEAPEEEAPEEETPEEEAPAKEVPEEKGSGKTDEEVD
jgi:large subunit ribosomal protein L19e